MENGSEFAERQRGAEEGKKKQAGAGKGQGIKPFGDCGKSKEGRKRREGRARGKGWRQTFFGAGESRGRQARSGFVIENGCLCGFVRKAERGKSREKDSERQTQKPTEGKTGKNKLCFCVSARRMPGGRSRKIKVYFFAPVVKDARRGKPGKQAFLFRACGEGTTDGEKSGNRIFLFCACGKDDGMKSAKNRF